MMKGLFIESDRLAAVYKNCQLQLPIVSKKDLLEDPALGAETEYLFATWGMEHFTVEEIKTCLPKLKAVFYAAGTVQHFAREFLQEGVRIFSAWGANAVPVAEYTAAQIILANKGFFQACARMSGGDRPAARNHFRAMPGNYGCRVGIIGAGMIGKMVLERLKDFRLETVVYDPFLSDEQAAQLGCKKVSLEELFSTCQTISNHVANLPATVGMLHGGLFEKMKPNATFINTGRGAQVVEADLIAALQAEPDRTAVLDVTYPEPPEEGSLLYALPNVFLTPHIAGSAGEEVARMGEYMMDQYRKMQAGEPCEYEVTEEMLERMA